ncbi:MAG: nucleotidyltransferase family protein [Deltaproteobacteria bacterium]|nr:nucleotidyltransferase family protein [Deltaproteobacteria bacterium]
MPTRVLVLAGRRSSGDALADASGCGHRALLPIAGVPMLLRVVRTLRESGLDGPIAVSAGDEDLLVGHPELASLTAAGNVVFHRSGDSPAASVADYFTTSCDGGALLVTTADHPLLTPEMVRFFQQAAERSSADFVVGLVPGSIFRARFPNQPRTFIVLKGEKFSGANLFYLRGPTAAAVPRFWTRAEHFRKQPWRLVSVFGLGNLALFAIGRLDLAGALARASRVIGAKVDAVVMPFAEAAIDVDREADRVTAEKLLAREHEGRSEGEDHACAQA